VGVKLLRVKGPGNKSFRAISLQGVKVPGSERAEEQTGQGTKGPGSERSRVLLADSLLEANWPGSEKAVNREAFGIYYIPLPHYTRGHCYYNGTLHDSMDAHGECSRRMTV